MFQVEFLENFTRSVFMKMGCSPGDAETITKVFIAAELRGISSHGMIRLKDYYELWKAGRINMHPDIRIVHESPSTAVVDGDNAVGMLPSVFSMELAIRKARESGTGWVATRNSNHFGIAGYYAMMALEHDMIGICMTNANPLVAPTFSVSRLLGTNPIAVAIPAGKQPPFVADFATTPIARGKLNVAARQGKEVPFGYVQDAEGRPSHDPDILKEGGSMVTLGSDWEHGSHKGYCLSSIVDIFSAIFSGANFGPFVPPSVAYLPVLEEKTGEGTGHFFGAMRIDAFQPADTFKQKMDQWIETFRQAKSMEGQPKVLIPGDPERENEKRIRKEGINIIPAVATELKEIAAGLGLEFR
jgi:LDH2 family malate/lactate/ureidoglycolate dehydrogenase